MSITAVAFLLAYSIGLLMALVRSPVLALYVYVGTFYLHPVDRWWGRDLPDLRWSLVAALVALIATISRPPAEASRPGWLSSPSARLLLLMTGWIWVQNIWALSSSDHLELSFLFTKYLVLLFLMHRLLASETAIQGFLLTHVAGCLYLGWLVLSAPEGGRLEGVGGPGIDEANALGMHLGTGAFAAAALMMIGTRWTRAVSAVALLLILNGIVQTESRGAFIGCIAGAMLFLVLSPPKLRRTWLILGLVGVAILVPSVPQQYWERLGTIPTTTAEQSTADSSTRTRLDLIEAQWKMFLRYPLGSGHRGTAYLSPQYLREDQLARSRGDPDGRRARSSHNTIMTVLAEQGAPGILIFAGILLWIRRASIKVHHELAGTELRTQQLLLAVTAATLAVVLVSGLFTDYLKAEIFVWALAWLTALELGPLKANPTASLDPATKGAYSRASQQT